MRWTRNPVYPLSGIGGLNPSSSATQVAKVLCTKGFWVKETLNKYIFCVYVSLINYLKALVHSLIARIEIHEWTIKILSDTWFKCCKLYLVLVHRSIFQFARLSEQKCASDISTQNVKFCSLNDNWYDYSKLSTFIN